MFEGFVSFAGQELINAARVEAYAAAGIAPQGVEVRSCVGSCEGLAEALGEPLGYDSPLADGPPWFDSEHPASADFAGLVPLGITGLRGSTRTVEVVERAGDGGIPLPGRSSSRTIGVSALAVGRTPEGLDAGLNWLSSALHPPCADVLPGCGGAGLDLFSACPEVCEGQVDPDSPVLNYPIPGALDGWEASQGKITQSAATATATQRVKNPSFEVDLTGWAATANATLARVITDHWVGSACATLTRPAGGYAEDIGMQTPGGTNAMAVTAGAPLQCWVRVKPVVWPEHFPAPPAKPSPGGLPGYVRVTLLLFDAAGVSVGTEVVFEDAVWQWPLPANPSWTTIGGLYTPGTGTAFIAMKIEVLFASGGAQVRVDGAFLAEAASPFAYFDGDTGDEPGTTFDWTGTPHNSTSTATSESVPEFTPNDPARPAHWLAPVQAGVCDEVTIVWRVKRLGATAATAQPIILNPTGVVLALGDVVQVGDQTTLVSMTVPNTPGFPDDWRPGLQVVGGGISGTLSILHRAVLTVEQCIADLRRSLHGVVTIGGPTVVETFADQNGDVAMARVEWTWVATRPYVYADPIPLFTRVPQVGSGRGDFIAPGVILTASAEVTQAATSCPLPTVDPDSCADYPCCTPLALPPAAPTIPDPCTPNIGSAPWVRRTYTLNPENIPAAIGVLNLAFEAVTKPVVGVRVRLWKVTDPAGDVIECEFANEWWIDYIPTGGVLVIDARAGTIETFCLNEFHPAGRVVRGPYRAAFAFPEVGCNDTYRLTVDMPKTYAAGCPDPGGVQGTLYASASLVRREG